MKRKILLDSYALLAYLKKEDNYRKVLELLNSAPDDSSIIINAINVGESYYIIARERGIKQADYFIETILPNLPIDIRSNSFDQIIDASRIKVDHPVSYADCFVVATAVREKAMIITGDPDFKRFKDIVDVEWI
ncbi:type II toxin-antitoxin system VapC family toxin [Thermodesulfovibrionales bacterium]|nr:type II toxin-antitoxin system VapC family toxin [Thermodesulfovibrionales bacterium]MCL0036830.1 type II toxin-antitoxin system VapC family toxin [Thermodesulfovibrionales bacterium]